MSPSWTNSPTPPAWTRSPSAARTSPTRVCSPSSTPRPKSSAGPPGKSTPTRGFGIACGTEKGGHVATCAEVAIDPASQEVRIVRVVQAWESGAVVNPDGLRNQNMGAIVQGIGGALFEAIPFADGRILNPHFADYRLPRFADAPPVEIVLLDRKDLPSSGAGEIGIVGIAPAVGNAIFAATGARLRNMPMAPSGPVPGLAPAPLTS